MPAWSNASTKAAALPSRIGTSAFDFDDDIVDAEPEQGGHQMLDGRDMSPDGSPSTVQRSVAPISETSARISLPPRAAALEHDAGIGVGRVEMDRDGLAAMDADAGQCNP